MRPNAGAFHLEFTSKADLYGAATERAVLRSIAPCTAPGCTRLTVQINTDPRSLAVPRFCSLHQPTALENNA